MATRTIKVQISKYERGSDITPIFQSSLLGEDQLPANHVAAVMKAVTGWTADDEDHEFLHRLHSKPEACRFKFGPDWEFFLEASVEYCG